MTEKVVFKGTWFLPSNIEQRVAGTLTHNADTGTQLEIEDSFDDQDKPFESKLRNVDIILGISKEGDCITLFSCFLIRTIWGNSYKAVWEANKVFVGCHALKPSDLCFAEVVLQVRPLFLWLNSSGIQITDFTTPMQSTTFTYSKPDNITFSIDEKVSGELGFSNSFSFPSSHSEAIEFTHSAALVIKTLGAEEIEYNELWIYVQRFINWLTVATGYSCEVEKVSFYQNNLIKHELSDGTKIRQEIVSYFKKQRISRKPNSPDQFLFDFPKLKPYMPDALTSWFRLYESIEIILQILSENMGRDVAFSEFHFKDIIQALEAFHRKLIRNERMNKTKYKAFKNKILSQIGDETERSFVKEQLNYANEPKLRERLVELINRCDIPSIQSIIGDKEIFVKLVIENRNYHTHLDKSGKKMILTPVELYHLSEKALALLFATILNEVIPDKEFINQTLRLSNRWGFRVERSNS